MPLPALNKGQSSKTHTACSTASTAEPPLSKMALPLFIDSSKT